MKRILALILAAATLALSAAPAAALPTHDSQGNELPTLAPMLEEVVPGVVNIFTRTRVPAKKHPLFSDPFFRRFFDLPEQQPERHKQSLGSGVILDAEKGYIITNHHVVERAVEIAVHLSDGRTLKAEMVGTDPETDIAVLQVKTDDLHELPVADSDTLRVGDFVVAVGNPFGLGQTVTSGIVSALGRSGLGIEGYEDFIQTDASINPGNSGGALVNLRGELVGINTAILSKSGGNVGIGFAIPINMAQRVTEQLVEHGEVRRGVLGVHAQDLTPDLAEAFGVKPRDGALVTKIEPGSPAAEAGLQPGDLITHVDGKPADNAADVRNRVGLLRAGQEVELRVLRDGEPLTLTARLERPEPMAVPGELLHPRLAGSRVGNIVEDMPMHGQIEGVVVLEVKAGSPAQKTGLRRGDVIVQANRRRVKELGALRRIAKDSDSLLLNVRRGNQAFFLVLR